MFKFLLLFVTLFLIFSTEIFSQRNTISGYVKEEGSGESLLGVSIFVPSSGTGTATNNYGFYTLTLPAKDTLEIIFSSVGYNSIVKKIPFTATQQLDVFLSSETKEMEEVVIVGSRGEKVSETAQMSTIDIPIHQIKDIPAFLGEKDVLKVIQLMPGVQKGGEGNSGIYVRGGGPDQNLLILDDATVYNAFHLFGFFSLFNGDALKSVELIKGGFPARYGGRLSSVIEMNMKDGSKEKIHGQAGIGLISSRLTLEGPIIKDKCSFLISARRSYLDVLLLPLQQENTKAGYFFYDINAKINYDFGRKNKVFLSGYFGKDKFYGIDKYNGNKSEFGLNWGNGTGTVRWNHLFNDKVFSNTSFIFSNYKFNIFSKDNYNGSFYNLDYFSGIRDFGLKYDLEYNPSPKNSIRAGFQSTYHRFTPGAVVIKSDRVVDLVNKVNKIDVLESGLYIQDAFRPTERIISNIGVRLSHFQVQGKSYLKPEPRLSVAYKLKKSITIKTSYALMNQYLHLLSNTGIGLPTDLWLPATRNIAPQRSQQVAAGIAKDFNEHNFAVTLEGYYKKSDNIIGYKEGASFLSLGDFDPNNNDPFNWEKNVTNGQAWSYGAEILLQRKIGKLSGWVGYTLSWTQMQFDSINLGKKFYARYDRRHDISVVAIYKPSERITLSGTWVYGTGNAITLPQSSYYTQSHRIVPDANNYSGYPAEVTEFSGKNEFRMAPYHRLDFGIQFHKKLKWGAERTWEISIYNVYNRKNPFFYYTETEQNSNGYRSVLKQITLFPLIPSVSYHIKF